ncbi:Gypsy retrotransposon integrase-like protein 1 [Cryomyces antarcticus]|uniref:Gypsy retrotransposon integrase-like protein 1 n=1 Tax=Cryomyces antarcticus TaxID=329879 RepID=A0ABR0KTQ8_9PEZI|nr:Gypsy retrotransposon integrase-like protein 1 [Cryomyces antarcticus]KAK5020162.1 Gypsy retrotransposon integrase-like protein 1 [Cryomyces antarcticus]KAK5130078.1 Gypsy retrotransposon integrase-like protein 1 [Cryomyces antarcticus]
MLYRPFTHSLSQEDTKLSSKGRTHAAAVAACLSASKHILHIAEEMKGGLLSGGHCFAIYASFFAVFSLVYFVLENPLDDRAPEVFRDARQGRDLMASFRDRSLVAEKCSVSLETFFDRLPIALTTGLDHAYVQGQNARCSSSLPSGPEYSLTDFHHASPTPSPNPAHYDEKSQTGGLAASIHANSFRAEPVPSNSPPQSVGRCNVRSTKSASSQGNMGTQAADQRHLSHLSPLMPPSLHPVEDSNKVVTEARNTQHVQKPIGPTNMDQDDRSSLNAEASYDFGHAEELQMPNPGVAQSLSLGQPDVYASLEVLGHRFDRGSHNGYVHEDFFLEAAYDNGINMPCFFDEFGWDGMLTQANMQL